MLLPTEIYFLDRAVAAAALCLAINFTTSFLFRYERYVMKESAFKIYDCYSYAHAIGGSRILELDYTYV